MTDEQRSQTGWIGVQEWVVILARALRSTRAGGDYRSFDMKIEEHHEANNVVILDLQGKLMIGDGDILLREKVEGLVEAGHRRIVLDLADVPYVDSAGLGEIVRCYTTLSRKNGRLKLRNPSKRIQDLLKVTKLLKFFGDDDEWPEGSGSEH